jgi:hypothetical protein
MASFRIGKKLRIRRCSESDLLEYLKRQREAEAAKVRERAALNILTQKNGARARGEFFYSWQDLGFQCCGVTVP